MNTFPFPAVLDVDHCIQLHITVPCLAPLARAAWCEPACGQWLGLLSLFGVLLVTGWWKPLLGLCLGSCYAAVLLLPLQHHPPKASHHFRNIWSLWYFIWSLWPNAKVTPLILYHPFGWRFSVLLFCASAGKQRLFFVWHVTYSKYPNHCYLMDSCSSPYVSDV